MKNIKAIGIVFLVTGLVSLVLYQKIAQNRVVENITVQSTIDSDPVIEEITEQTGGLDENVSINQEVSNLEKQTAQFVQKKMIGKYGIYTNYLDTLQKDQVATGHEVLSESAGLYLCYTASRGNKTAFYKLLKTTKSYLDNGVSFSYRYTPQTHKKSSGNAAIDDLRLIRALYKGAAIFDDPSLKKETTAYGKRFVETNIHDNQLVDFYDSKLQKQATNITLCYIDLDTLKLLPMAKNQKNVLVKNQEEILKNGYLSDAFPLYKTRYDYKKKKYIDSQEINVIESLITILHLSKEKLETQASIEFLKEKVGSGTLYNRYDKEGKVVDENQSTAAYALCALIAAVVHDQKFYQEAMSQVEKFQVMDTTSPIDGGFGKGETMEAYSFDNLMALLAFTVSGQ